VNTNISIIIPAHNEENYIRKTLHSIRNQTHQDFEIIVVSNGCTDNTENIVKKRANEKLKHFSVSEANVSKSRNYGAEQAQGELLLFLDADTILEQDSLQKIKKIFSHKYSVATTLTDYDSAKIKFKFAKIVKNFYHQTNLYQGCSGALICRKDDFFKVGKYPEIIVKEHRKLIIELKKLGKFTCINTITITSARRFKKWGLTKATWFWIKQWAKNYYGDLKKSDYERIR